MESVEKNFAYIDSNNLHRGIKNLGWEIDYKKFRVWLSEKYNVTEAYTFIGLIPKNKSIYTQLQKIGFSLIFKEVVYFGKGEVKGNCDAELVLNCTRDVFERKEDFDKIIIVAGDGDYACLIEFLRDENKLKIVLSPTASPKKDRGKKKDKCSILIKKLNIPIVYLGDKRSILEKQDLEVEKEKAPDADETA